MERILSPHITRPFTTDAPSNVVIAPWRQGKRLAVHVLHTPDSLLRLTHGESDFSRPEDIVPTAPIHIDVPGDWSDAETPLNQERLSWNTTPHGIRLEWQSLEQHAVIVLG